MDAFLRTLEKIRESGVTLIVTGKGVSVRGGQLPSIPEGHRKFIRDLLSCKDPTLDDRIANYETHFGLSIDLDDPIDKVDHCYRMAKLYRKHNPDSDSDISEQLDLIETRRATSTV